MNPCWEKTEELMKRTVGCRQPRLHLYTFYFYSVSSVLIQHFSTRTNVCSEPPLHLPLHRELVTHSNPLLSWTCSLKAAVKQHLSPLPLIKVSWQAWVFTSAPAYAASSWQLQAGGGVLLFFSSFFLYFLYSQYNLSPLSLHLLCSPFFPSPQW